MRYTNFIKTCTAHEARLQHISTLVDTYTDHELSSSEIAKLKLYLTECKSKFSTLEKNLDRLYSVEKPSEDFDDKVVLKFQNTISELCINIQATISSLLPEEAALNETVSDTNVASGHSTHSVRLPKIELQTFDGDSKNWLSYINLFDSTIHNNTILSLVEKHKYLISSLRGEALDLVKSLQFSSGNYLIAYNALRDRYHSTRRLLSLHLNKIIDLPNIDDGSSKHLRHFLNDFNENERALSALDCQIKDDNPVLSTLLLRKMSVDLRKTFESGRGTSTEMPTVKDIIDFLNGVCIHEEDANLNSCHSLKGRDTKSQAFSHPRSSNRNQFGRTPVAFVSTETFKCFCCNDGNHSIYGCPNFMNKTPQERYQLIITLKRCVNCLGSHPLKLCKSKQSCKRCFKPHHTVLHFPKATNTSQPGLAQNKLHVGLSEEAPQSHQDDSRPKHDSKTALLCEGRPKPFSQHESRGNSTVLLATTLLKIKTITGVSHVVRGIIDSASQCSFITEHAAQLLNVERTKSCLSVDGISSASTKVRGLTYLNIETLNHTLVAQNHPVLILEKITSVLPRNNIHPDVCKLVKHYDLADPSFHLSGPIDFLIGGELFAKILTGENQSLGDNLPNIVGTVFGFVLMGVAPCLADKIEPTIHSHLTTLLSVSDLELHNSLQRFWSLDEAPTCHTLSKEEIYCDEHFSKTHTRDQDGRYVVRLPMKPNHEILGESFSAAKHRQLSLEKRFATQPDFKRQYVEFMTDYENAGHMEKCDQPVPPTSEHCILGHHGVVKETSSTTRLRVVFDASMKTSNQLSLNDVLLAGPKLQPNVCEILLNFRKYNVIFSCDIRQMYRQIRLHPDDQQYQMILWRENATEPLSLYQLKTVTYGVNCAPFLAIRTLKQLAYDEGSDFPEATNILLHQTYIDDSMGGHDTEEEALKLRNQLIDLLRKGGFELRKWISTSNKLLEDIPKEFHEVPMFMHRSSDSAHFSILGLHWCAKSDTFSYDLDISDRPRPNQFTKRQVLSLIAQIFDPVGFVSPVVMKAKCFLQLLWTEKLNWDDPLPSHLASTWNKFLSELSCISEIKIPRALSLTKGCSIQLHGFSDASLRGYAAVVFIRCISNEGKVIVRQLISKTRLAPLKSISLPRLELCGSHILAKLMKFCIEVFSSYCTVERIFNWCDSTVVLAWISTAPYRLRTFVSNRVAEIQELTPSHSWNHVSSEDNPADCASRGLLPSELHNQHLWFTGPQWLTLPISEWPKTQAIQLQEEEILELKSEPLALVTTSKDTSSPIQDWNVLNKFSSWLKLRNTFAYILRFIYNCQHLEKRTGPFCLKELQEAESKIFKIVQENEFSEDILLLKKNKTCSTRLLRLAPFLDTEGIVRVGGRLRHSSLEYESKFPILLPKSNHVVHILIDFYHTSNLHAGQQLLQSLLAQRFWILSSRCVIRSRIYRCIRCFKCKPRNTAPLMGDLPSSRVNYARPFLITGIDFCGHFTAKFHTVRSARSFKIYICVFVCFTTKAVHLEVVTDLTTSAFIAALSRFISRRGLPSKIYSDCGTNFLGADSYIKSIRETLFKDKDNQQKICEFSNANSFSFHFNSPSAPHMGGLWESAVKSFKYHLIRVIGQEILTVEEFFTLAAKIEAILNSRPLTPLTADPSEFTALTPGHFLIGSSLLSLPEHDVSEIPINRLKRWQRVQSFTQNIWKRWSVEYLHTLQQRCKWLKKEDNLKVGDLVIIQDTRTAPLCWPLGRIISTYPGEDGVVRVLKIQTPTGCYVRPAVKVFPLPIVD